MRQLQESIGEPAERSPQHPPDQPDLVVVAVQELVEQALGGLAR
jgi:hypothetical protein